MPRALREIISSEAGANDGFGFPFLMLAVYLIRHADIPGAGEHKTGAAEGGAVEGVAAAVINGTAEVVHRAIFARNEEVGRLGGGVGMALVNWLTETWLYIVFLSVLYGAVVGYGSCKIVKFALHK